MLRITGGEFKGRALKIPDSQKVRPTLAKLRQALFNSIQMRIPDARVLDLFSGSGSLGFEALSRGASHVSFVELSKNVAKLIQQNAATLEVEDRIDLTVESAERYLARPPAQLPIQLYDLVLIDPPYADGWEMLLLKQVDWTKWINPDGALILEWGTVKSQFEKLPEVCGALTKVREKEYGDSRLTTYVMRASHLDQDSGEQENA